MDPLYELAEAIYRFMGAGPSFPLVLLFIVLASIPVALVHELGHAVVARHLLGTPVEVSVGNVGQIAQLRLGQITASINAVGGLGSPSGIAVFDASEAGPGGHPLDCGSGTTRVSPRRCAGYCPVLRSPSDGVIHDLLWAALLGSVFGVLNLIPLRYRDRRDGPTHDTDGRLILDALRVSRALR